jgi:hypothetical protein
MRTSPFRLRKSFSLLIAVFAFTSIRSIAQPMLVDVESTPYDRQMARVRPTLAAMASECPDRISLTIVNQWMARLRRLPYRYSRQWQTPAEVKAAKVADCKGKAIMLYDVMQLIGAKNVRFVIGKHRAGDWFTHAWLQWEAAEGTYVLDPTFNWRVMQADRQDSTKYVPLYAYEGMLRYRAVDAMLVAERPLRAVAAGNHN